MSNAGSSEHWITVTFKVWLLKSYSSLYCNLPRYSLDAAEAPVAIKLGEKYKIKLLKFQNTFILAFVGQIEIGYF